MSDSGFPPLQPLRIPAGITVRWNAFWEPNAETRFQDYQNEDIFSALRDELWVDLGWYPAGDLTGRYVLLVVGPPTDADDDPWSHPLYRFETRIRQEVIAELERVLERGI